MSIDSPIEVSLQHILERPGDFSGWLYLPPMPWALDTEGAFFEDVDDAEADVAPAMAAQPGWKVTLDSATIEDIVSTHTIRSPSPASRSARRVCLLRRERRIYPVLTPRIANTNDDRDRGNNHR